MHKYSLEKEIKREVCAGTKMKDVLSTFPSSWKNVTGIAIIFRTVSVYGFWLTHAKSAIIIRKTYKVLTFHSSVYRDRSHRIVALTHFLTECKLVFYHCFQLACNPSCANYIVFELREKLINKMRLYRTRGWVQITKKRWGGQNICIMEIQFALASHFRRRESPPSKVNTWITN